MLDVINLCSHDVCRNVAHVWQWEYTQYS